MQRQSLGSPISKLHIHEQDEISLAGCQIRRDNTNCNDAKPRRDNTNCNDAKPRRLSFSTSSSLTSPLKSQKLIHFIPLLTLICFLVLYLTSYTPSQSDLDYFNGFKHSSNLLESSEIGVFEKGDIWTIRSPRNLQLAKHIPMSRPNRKLAHL